MDQGILAQLDHALAKRGRPARVDVDSLTGNLKALVVPFKQRADSIVRRVNAFLPAQSRTYPHIAFCEGTTYGAFTFRERFDFIVLNIGLVPTLTDLFQRMMATAGLWPTFGEQNTFSVSEACGVPEGFRGHMLWSVLPIRAPTDLLRIALATVFMSECFDQIVRHELAHLILGHLNEDVGSIRADPIAAQALEFAADGHAAIWGLEPLRDLPRKLGRRPGALDDAYREFLRSPHDAFMNYLLVIFLTLRILDENDWTARSLASATHPPAPMRFHGVCIHLVDYFRQTNDTDGEAKVLQAMQNIWELGEQIFTSTFEIEPNPAIKQLTLSELSEAHYNLMSEKARTLPPHLFGIAG